MNNPQDFGSFLATPFDQSSDESSDAENDNPFNLETQTFIKQAQGQVQIESEQDKNNTLNPNLVICRQSHIC